MSLKEKQKEFKKKIICEVAYNLFSSKPVESVSVEEIARLVGCAKGTIYLYFKNKDEILNHLVSQGLQKLCSDMAENCLSVDDIQVAISNYTRLQFQFFREYHFIISSWVRRRMEGNIKPESIKAIDSMLEKKVQIVTQMLEKGIKDGHIIQVDAYQLANLIESVVREATFPFTHTEIKDSSDDKLTLLSFVLNNGIMVRNTT
ncbi:MAG: TetR/AcrR family transcriptional regulator [Syntrophomonas sp.]